MLDLAPVLKTEEIVKAIANLANRISSDFTNRVLTLVGVLKGALIFPADLCRHIYI
jgi:hypoxanthine-guanine phosphoribosyltransferase